MKPITIDSLLQAALKHHPALDKIDAVLLLAYVLKKPQSALYAWPESEVTQASADRFMGYLMRRLNGEPIAYIIGRKDFWSFDLMVNQHTLVPRPETELLIEATLARIDHAKARIADLGAGSGAIALALAMERPAWTIHAVDLCEKALFVAQENQSRLGLNTVSFRQGSWCTGLDDSLYDAIVSNPPYLSEEEWPLYASGLAFEPRQALVSGADGLSAIREIIQTAKAKLAKGGYLLLEHGYQQGSAVRQLLLEAGGYEAVVTLRDLAGHERVTVAQSV